MRRDTITVAGPKIIMKPRAVYSHSHKLGQGTSSTCFVNLSCAYIRLVLVPHYFLFFVGQPFFLSASWPLSFLSLFFFFSSSSNLAWFMHEYLTGVGLFVHGHVFLHSWSGPITLVVGLLRGATFQCNFHFLLFLYFKWS